MTKMGKVKSAVIETDYMADTLILPEIDIEMREAMSIQKKFENSEHSLVEGCAGRMGIDTTYENITDKSIKLVRSDYSDSPAPEDVASGNYPHRLY